MNDQFLVKIDRATRLLAECDCPKEVKKNADMAAAARVWAKRTKASAKHKNYATAFELRCERRLGEILEGMPKAKGSAGTGRPNLGGTKKEPPKSVQTLSDLGISKKESCNAHLI